MDSDTLSCYLDRLGCSIEALRAASYGIAAAFEAEETITPQQVYCLLKCLANEMDTARLEMQRIASL